MVEPLRIKRLRARGFRNLEPLDLEPCDQFNVVFGDNGSGKTNLLEAVYYLAALKSFRGGRTDDLIQLGSDEGLLRAQVVGDVAPRVFEAALGRHCARRLSLDGKRPRSVAQWHTSLQAVLFHPGDLVLAAGSPEARRSFLDRILEQMDATYASALASYTKALRSRNRLLRMEGVDRRSITAFDPLLASAGAVITQSRAELVEQLAPLTEQAFERITAKQLPFEVRYAPRVSSEVDAITAALERSLPKDLARGFTAEGPHGDDLALVVRGDTPARHHASQGQQRVIALSMKIAELEVLSQRVGRVPILLLDDVSSELDRARNRRLFEVLAELGGQVFLSTTHREFILLEEQRLDFRVIEGAIQPER